MLLHFDLVEEFASNEKKTGHWGDHTTPPETGSRFPQKLYPNADKYEKAADKLAQAFCRTSDPFSKDRVIGFIANDGTYYKYDTKFNVVVVYKPDKNYPSGNLILTYFPPDEGIRYYKRKMKDYQSDIPVPKKEKEK